MIGADCHGVRLQVESEDPAFEGFVARTYRAFLTEAPMEADIRLRFGPAAGTRARRAKDGMAAFGMGLYCDNASLYWENQFGFAIQVTPTFDGGFEIAAYHFDLERETDLDLRARNHQRALRWALHFPVFRLLRQRRGLSLVHASALVAGEEAREERALVFCGLNTVGKSTLAAFMAQQPGYRFMTDNFLLAGQEQVFGFPETLRLGAASLDRLEIAADASPTVYGKHHVEIAPERICLQAEPAACFLVGNGSDLSVEPIAPERALAVLAGLHDYLGEFPEHSFWSGLPLLTGIAPEHSHSAPTVLAERPWFRLSLPLDWKLADVKELVETCI